MAVSSPQFVVPFLPHRVVSEIVALVAGIPRCTVNALVESLSHYMVCQEDAVRRDLVPGHTFHLDARGLRRSLQGTRHLRRDTRRGPTDDLCPAIACCS